MKGEDLRKIDEFAKLRNQIIELEKTCSQQRVEFDELQKIQALFHGLFQYAPDAIIVVNKDGRIVQANAQAEKIFGYGKNELLDRNVNILIPLRFRERHNEQMKEYILKPRIRLMGSDLELYGLRKDGTEFPVDISLSPLETKEGITVLSIVRDITELKSVEKQLHSTSLYTRSLIEASLDPLATISPDGIITDVNKATEEVTGVSREKLIGSDFSEYFTEPDKAREGYRHVFEKGIVRDYPLAIRHTSGEIKDVLYNATVYRNETGEVEGVFAAARDITELKRAEQQLRAASLYTRSLIEANLDPLVTISPKGIITDVNRASEEVTGVSRKKLIGSDFSEYFTEPDKAREGYRHVFEKGIVRDYPLAIRHTSREVTDVLYNATVYRNEAGEVEGVFAAARDITEHKRMEEAIRTSEAKYRGIFENAVEGIFQTSIDGRILSVNPACVNILGYDSAEELIASVTDVRKLYAEPGRRLHLVRLIRADGTVSDFEAMVNRKDGSKIWVSINAHAMKDATGKVLGLEGMIMDITNRKRAEKNFQMLIDGSPDAIIAIDRDFNILLINTQTEKLFGYTPLELIGKSYDMLLPEDIRNKHARFCKDYFANPSTRIMALHMGAYAMRKDDSEFPVEINMSPVETDEGNIIVIDIRDVTEKKK